MRIVQIAESLSIGDAVANDVVAIDSLLKQMGVCGGIYITNAGNINKRYLHKIAEPIDKLPEMEEDDLLLFHHAIANDFCYQLPKLPCRKVLIYHNITPPSFFEGLHEGFRDATQRGLDQIKALNQTFECCIAVSEFNKENLIDMGYTCPIYVCPILIPFEDYRKTPTQEIIERYSDGRKNFLFVGRLAPNKKQEDIIRAFAVYKKYYDSDARLFLVGSDGVEAYGKALREYVAQLGVEDVIITGAVPFPDILAYYSIADVFVCMSEHEGFCVPLVEAMFFDVPVLAYASCAIPYTLEESGVLLENKDFALIAGWMHRLATDETLREHILEGQRKRLNCFSYSNVEKKLRRILNLIINRGNNNEIISQYKSELKKNVKENANPFAVVLPIKASDWAVAKRTISLIWDNINPRQIVIISSSELLPEIVENDDVVFVDQDHILDGLTFENVKKTLEKAGGNPAFSGWFLKQFLTFSFSFICDDEYYLVWDSDTMPLRPMSFFDEQTKKPIFTLKREYVPQYFKTLKKLLGMDKIRAESFISEHLMIKPSFCIEMCREIENNKAIKGKYFWEKCIYACNFSDWSQPFADYETYPTFVMYRYPEAYECKKRDTLRPGVEFFGAEPSEKVLEWVSKDFDIVSFEHWGKALIPWSVTLSKNERIRNEFSAAQIIRWSCMLCKIKALTGNDEDKQAYHDLQLRMEFDYFFGDQTIYERDYLKTQNALQ